MASIRDNQGDDANVDRLNKALVQIDSVHANIHDGIMFQADLINVALANDGILKILIRVPSGDSAHLRFQATNGGEGRAQLFSGPTTTLDGAALAAVNRNTFSTTTANVLAFSGPTVTVNGTAMSDLPLAGGSGGNASGGTIGSFEEWILQPGDYLAQLTNLSGQAHVAGIALDWYEPGQRE